MKIAVASCCKLQDVNPQPVWSEIQAENVNALLLLGDNIYLEHDRHNEPSALSEELRGLYSAQFSEIHFSRLVRDLDRRGAPLIAIYDDHDFLGNNRYGADYGSLLRLAARAEFIRAFSPAMTGSDVYHVRHLGIVDVVVLDERFYRESPHTHSGRDAILGARQWAWFEDTVTASSAQYLLVASSTTIHRIGDESWEEYPAAFERLRSLLSNRKGAFVVSGDVHRNATFDDSGILEIVTSGVARNSVVFGRQRRNYAILEFDQNELHVDLRSNKVNWRLKFSVTYANWELP